MKPNRSNPLFANTFRSNTLAAAVVISLSAAVLPDAVAQSISVNFGANQAGSSITESAKTTGAVPVAGNRWNNTTVNGGGTLSNLIDSTGATTSGSVTWTANNTWQSGSSGATATSENGDLTKGYLDDSGTGWTVNLSSPYLLSNIYVIHATDQGNPATMSAVSVNGTFYKGNGAGGTIPASGIGDSWSAANFSTANTLVESTNYLKIANQARVSLAGYSSSPGRAAIAGVQVENSYTGTLSFWDIDGSTAGAGGATPSGNWSDASWSASAAGDASTGAWSSGAAVFAAGSDATGSYAVDLGAGTQTADAVWVQEGNVTLTGGTLALTGPALLRGDAPLTVNSALSAGTLTTSGTVTLGSANTISGVTTIHGGTLTLAASLNTGSLSGIGSISMGANNLSTGADNTDSAYAGVLSGTGQFTKSGTGTLTVGGTNTYAGTTTVNGGTLTLASQQALGQTTGVNITSGRVNLAGQSPGGLATGGYSWTIAGTGTDGAGGLGAIINTGGDVYASSGIKSLTLAGDAEIGSNNGRFDVGRHENTNTYGTITGGGFTLTKVGSNSIIFRAPASDITYVVNAGTLTFEDNDAASGTNPITVNGGTLSTYGGRIIGNAITMASGTTLGNNGGGSGTWTGALTLSGAAGTSTTVNAGGQQINLGGALSGTANLNVTGGNWTALESTGNTGYTGKATVNGGNLRIAADDSLGTAPVTLVADAITLTNGGRLQGGTKSTGGDVTLSANRGITLSGGNGHIHSWGGFTMTVNGPVSGAGTLMKTDTGTAVFNGAINITGNFRSEGGTAAINAGSTSAQVQLATATLNIGTGANVSAGRLVTSDGYAAVSVINHSGGTVSITGTNNNNDTGASFLLGHWGYGSSTNYNLSGGTLNAHGAEMSLGWDSANVHFNQSGGTANFLGIDLNNGRGNGNTDYNLTGGRINLGANGITNQANKSINLGSGTVGAFANWSTSKPLNLTGTTTFDTLDSVDGTSARTITLTGALSGTGGLTKAGAGTLNLSAASTYAGATAVNGGKLHVGPSLASPSLTVNAGGALQPGTSTTAGTSTVPALTLSGGDVTFRASYSGGDKLVVSGNDGLSVTSASTITVIPAGNLMTGDRIPLIDYTGTATGLGMLTATPLPNPHYSANIVPGSSANSGEDDTMVVLEVGAADSITWLGNVNGTWDEGAAGTSNWTLDSNTNTTKFYSQDVVRFNDDGLGTPVVTLSGTITPASLTVENTSGTYTFQGAAITGTTGLTKTQAGTLVLLNTNTYTGATTISGGTVSVGDGGTTGTLGGSGNITLGSATLRFNRSDAQTLGRTVAGSGGTLVKDGSNTLTMSAGNNTCDIVINSGTLAARGGDWATSFAANRTITINTGGTLDTVTHSLNGLGGGARPAAIVINEDAVWKLNNEQYLPATTTMTAGIINGPGEIRGGGTIHTVAHAAKSATINSPVNVVGAITFNVEDGSPASDLVLTGGMSNGSTLTKAGAGTMEITNAGSFSGTLNLSAGTLLYNLPGAASIGNRLEGAATLRNGGGGAMTLSGNSNTFAGTIDGNGKGVVVAASTSAGSASASVQLKGETLTLATQPAVNEPGKLFRVSLGGQDFSSPVATSFTTADLQELHNTSGTVVPGNTTYAYAGEIYLTGGTTYSFAENFDDAVLLKIDGQTLINNATWNQVGNGSITPTTSGWYSIDLRVYQGGGGVGPAGSDNWTSGKGVGIKIGAATTDGNDYLAFTAANLTSLGVDLRAVSPGFTMAANVSSVSGTNTIDTSVRDATIAGAISGSAPITKSGSNTLFLAGANTHTGNTTVNAGTLDLTSSGSMQFVLGDAGATNSVGGTATAAFHGTFNIDTSSVTDATGTWNLVTVSGKSFGATFSISGFADPEDDGVWTKTQSGKLWSFSESTGTLTLANQAGYDTWASGYGLTGNDALRGSDPDGDGFTNLQEFLFGTNPTTNTGSLTTTEQSGGILTIRWNERTSGATYLLKESATLANDWANWGGTPATDGPVSGDYQPMKADVTIGAGKDFFRVEGVEN